MVVMALASSSCTVLPVAVLASDINTYYTQTNTSTHRNKTKYELLMTKKEPVRQKSTAKNRLGKIAGLYVTSWHLTELYSVDLNALEAGTQMEHQTLLMLLTLTYDRR